MRQEELGSLEVTGSCLNVVKLAGKLLGTYYRWNVQMWDVGG